MTHNESKYFVEESDLLTDAEKICMVQALRELESQGVLEYRDGFWGLAAGVEIEETPDGAVAHFLKQKAAVESHCPQSLTPSSGEPSETRVPPLEQAARPSSQGPGSPDSDDELKKNLERDTEAVPNAIAHPCSKARKSK